MSTPSLANPGSRRLIGARSAGIAHRKRFVLELHLTRVPVWRIAEMTGYSISRVYGILNEPEVASLRQQILEGYDLEFGTLHQKAIDTLEELMDSPDDKVRSTAVKTYFREYGRRDNTKKGYAGDGSGGTSIGKLSAEQVIVNILNQGQGQDAIGTE